MRALIIEDEVLPANHLAMLIDRYCPQISSTEICLLPLKAIELLGQKEYDLIFLDIQMPNINGFELLEQIVLPKRTKVIITSGYIEFAVDAFNLDVSFFLVKPIKQSKLIEGIRKVFSENLLESLPNEEESNFITVFYQSEYHVIKQEEILRLEAARSYTQLILNDKKFITSNGLGYYEKKLSDKFFYRCHNSHIINVTSVAKLGKGKSVGKGGYIVLSNEDVVPIGSSKREALEKRIGI